MDNAILERSMYYCDMIINHDHSAIMQERTAHYNKANWK